MRRRIATGARHGRLQLVLAVAAIAVAVSLPVVLVSVGGGVSAHEISQIEQSGYVISVVPPGTHGLSGAHAIAREIGEVPDVAASSPVLSIDLYLYAGGSVPTTVLAEGIIPGQFPATLGPSESGLFPSPLPLGDPTDLIHFDNGTYDGPAVDEVLISKPLARDAGLGVNQTVVLSAVENRSAGTPFLTTGQFGVPPPTLGPSQVYLVILPLSDLQVLTGLARTTGSPSRLLDAADTIQVTLAGGAENSPAEVQSAAQKIQLLVPNYGVTTQLQQVQQLEAADAILTGFYLALSSVGLTVGLMFLAIVLVRRVESDRRSIGIRRAVGVPGSQIAGDILLRGLALAAAGIVLGVAIGASVVGALARWGSGGAQEAASLAVYDPGLLGAIAAALLGLAALASTFAVRSALRLDIGEALR